MVTETEEPEIFTELSNLMPSSATELHESTA